MRRRIERPAKSQRRKLVGQGEDLFSFHRWIVRFLSPASSLTDDRKLAIRDRKDTFYANGKLAQRPQERMLTAARFSSKRFEAASGEAEFGLFIESRTVAGQLVRMTRRDKGTV